MAQGRAQGPRHRDARQAAVKAVLALPPQEQIETTLALIDLVGGELGGESVGERRLRRRAQGLHDIGRAAEALGLPAGGVPTVHQYDPTARDLGLLSSQQIIRAFGRWSNATRALRGERMPETPEQRARRLGTTGKQRSHEDYLTGVRLWLDSSAESDALKSYDMFVDAYNKERDEGELPLVRGNSIRAAFGLSWTEILSVVRGETELAAAVEARRDRARREAGSIGLIGNQGVALLLGHVSTATPQLVKEPGFPTAVARVGKTPVWLLSDIDAYSAEQVVPTRHEGEMQDELIESPELAEALGIQLNSLHAQIHRGLWGTVPPPGATVGGRHVWRRVDVDAWFRKRGRAPRAWR